jgi:hypothetical protein
MRKRVHLLFGAFLAALAPVLVPAAPADLAAHLEDTLLSGAGVMFPDETRPAEQHCGDIAMDDSWPAAFLDRFHGTISGFRGFGISRKPENPEPDTPARRRSP